MQVRIWGCRGSLATPGRETLRYGGNTSCVEIETGDGTRIILDAGTGIRGLGRRLAAERASEIHLCLTHLHLDHIEGIGFFAPIFDPETVVHIWGPPSSVRSLDERLSRYLSAPLFPVEIGDFPASFVFHDVGDEPWEIGSARLVAEHVSHPGATLGYRVEADGASIAYLPDHEPAIGVDLERLTSDWVSGFSLAAGATVLIHDAQYTDLEYLEHVGWGHSSVSQAVSFAVMADVSRLLLFHHDPVHTDEDLDAHGQRAHELWRGNGTLPELAYEGMEIRL
jgi:phosphoribosyl 1,2-cyclic phosphodiesterase